MLIPWIVELDAWQTRPRACEGRFGYCKNKARWQYRYGKKHWSRADERWLFCTSHLFHSALIGDMEEEYRYNMWWKRWGKKWVQND